jgi:hypothetical protein
VRLTENFFPELYCDEYDGVRALELDNGKNEKSEEVALKLKNCRCERAALRTDRVEELEIVRADLLFDRT